MKVVEKIFARAQEWLTENGNRPKHLILGVHSFKVLIQHNLPFPQPSLNEGIYTFYGMRILVVPLAEFVEVAGPERIEAEMCLRSK